MNRNAAFLDSGISKLNYYDKIPRTSDLLKSAEFAFTAPELLISKFYIAPATLRFDNMVEEAIYELNIAVSHHLDLPDEDDILNLTLLENIDKYKNKKARDVFQDHLQRKGFSGELIKVASDLNSSTMDQFSRAILSEEGIFFYLAYRSIAGNGIKDPEGIASNMLNALGLVKSYINISLVDKVIAKENLDVTKKERARLKKQVENRKLSYFPGNPEKTIVKLFDDLKSGGHLLGQVMEFLNSDKVKLPRHTDKQALAQKMVNYLLRLGYNDDLDHEPEDGGSTDTSPGESHSVTPTNETPIVPDDFQIIENVGPTTNEKFLNAGIYTFAQLAGFDVDGLKSFLYEPMSHINYESIIEQARLITSGSFSKLVEYQNSLNKKKEK